ncbi:MAG: thioredoxin [Propionibacteriaceae bacterium]|jgi:thioredoxin 1|nr:thioredoxin [Propionibacteriaceae bacterium]
MATIDLTGETFDTTVTGNPMVFVDFWAAWCGPCRMFGPVFEEASEEHPDIVFGKVDTEAERGLAQALGIQAIPTLMGFRDGILIFRESGALNRPQFAELIKQARALDMDEVRKQVAANE